ncbi:S9 family peptidase [Amycolatopsis sp. GM8]|uniref:alpha/beta hydrolase family protein n=1 Tax=Amycolatopsis sp. GM8 TaxID=2896530 RepID=UPI001F3D0367|nr:hypothetical protein [Amycolatopsis sp. GM8]
MPNLTATVRSHHRVFTDGFFGDQGLDFQTRGVLGKTAHGAADAGEVLATVARVRGHRGWFTEWFATAERVEAIAVQARDQGHRVSAAEAFLRAATYWACALDAARESALRTTFRRHRACWDAFIAESAGAHLQVEVPYEGGTLPGYLLRPDASGQARPTLVVTNGSDGAISDLWSGGGVAAALKRGWNAFVYDGPGQQSLLFERGVPFRPDWEAVLGPVLDVVLARPDVDPDRTAGCGVSQGGYWLPRALAFEHRLRAAVVDPGVVDVSASWLKNLPASMVRQLDDGDRAGFLKGMGVAERLPALRRTLEFRGRPYARADWFDLFRTVREYKLDPADAARITTPLLITDPEGEQFWPGQSRRLAGLVPGAELVAFTDAEGASWHCEPLARLLADQRMFDWLEERTA